MGTITSGIGLVSGLNTKDIIDQLIAIESQPKALLQTRISTTGKIKDAYGDLQTQLAGLQSAGKALSNPTTFQASSASSSDENVLTASAANGAAVGAFQFQVARLVTSQQAVTDGFADTNNAKVGAGTISLSQGGGELTSSTNLADLRGGQGIRRGNFRISDRNGKSAVIDITSAVTLDDVVKKINTSLDVNVEAKVDGQGLQIFDLNNAVNGDLIIQDVAGGHAAEDLGITGDTDTQGILGADVNYLGRKTSLAQLNDGRGVRSGSSGGGADFRILARDGSTYDVTLTGNLKNVGDVLDTINAATGGSVKADLAPGADGIRLTDTTGGGGPILVAALNNANTAKDLGLDVASTGGELDGGAIIAGLNTVLVSSLNGGHGLALGTIAIRDRQGGVAAVDLSAAKTVADVLSLINDPANDLSVTASLNASGNGIQLADTSGATGDLTVGDAAGTTAADLGLAGTFDSGQEVVSGRNLHRQYVTENSSLADYNGGRGVALGKFKITTADGQVNEIDLAGGNFLSLGQVIKTINARQIGVTASINADGNGLQLTDTTGGAGLLKVEDGDGTTAGDLNIRGEAGTDAPTVLDGAFEKTLEVTANDTLQSVQQKINDLGFGVNASIINDGSAGTPYRLSLSAKNTGRAGRFVFDAGSTGLQTHDLVDAQDAAVFIGGAGAAQPLLVTSSKNQLANVIKGVTVDLHGVSDKPVTLSITRSVEGVVAQVQKFTDGFNALVDKLSTLTKFDSKTNTGGLLLGESTAQQIETNLYAILSGVVKNAGKYRILADVGLKLGDGAKLTFDSDKFKAAYADNPQAVQTLFAQADSGIGALIQKQTTKLIDPVTGTITRQNQTLDTRTREFQDRITSLDALISQKRKRLETQFASLESVLSGLQSQQQALGSLSGATTTTKAGSSSSK